MPEHRNFPSHTLKDALAVAEKIRDDMAGKPFRRLLLADALGMKPGSSNFRDLLSSSYKYGLTDGTEKALEISLTATGSDAVQNSDEPRRRAALRKAAFTPSVFRALYEAYEDAKIPSTTTMRKRLADELSVPEKFVDECAKVLMENGRLVGIIRDIGGSPHVISGDSDGAVMQALQMEAAEAEQPAPGASGQPTPGPAPAYNGTVAPDQIASQQPRPIFVGHGKNRAPLDRLTKFLDSFGVPHRVVVDEANLGRPISQKVRETMRECGSAILIFTADEKFLDESGGEIWRPSENVVYELGAASYSYDDRIVIFKEKGISFPSNFKGVGYIEFEENSIESKAAELLKELVGFGLLKITPA